MGILLPAHSRHIKYILPDDTMAAHSRIIKILPLPPSNSTSQAIIRNAEIHMHACKPPCLMIG